MLKKKIARFFAALFGELTLKRIILTVVGSMIAAFGLFNVHAQSGVTEGGVLGLSLLLEHWLGLSPSISSLVLNICCYILGWKLLAHDFIGCSVIAGAAFSLFYAVFEAIGPVFPFVADMPLAAAFLGAAFIGVGVGLAVRAGGAPGGDDALAMSLAHVTKLNIKWIYLFCDLVVLAMSLSYIPLKRILYSLLTVVLSGQCVGLVATIGRKRKGENNGSAQ